jgi:hypothetical protein
MTLLLLRDASLRQASTLERAAESGLIAGVSADSAEMSLFLHPHGAGTV